jgi:thermitase
MAKRWIFTALIALLAGHSSAHGYRTDQVLVRFEPGTEVTAYTSGTFIGARVAQGQDRSGATLFQLPPHVSVDSAIRYFQSFRAVEYAEPNVIYRSTYVPNDPRLGEQPGLVCMNVFNGWAVNRRGPGVVIAIVDTGVATDHPDLVNKLVPGYDFVNNDADPRDDQGHGTHCAGVAAASTDNGVGIAGVGFNARVMPVKVLGADGFGTLSNVASGIRWAVDNGARIISLSLGSTTDAATLRNAITYAWGQGAVVVAAAGNEATDQFSYPAAYPEAIAVAATDNQDRRAGFSNFGSWVDVAAPGVDVLSTVPGGYARYSGTSMACPAVAGLAALLISHLGASWTNQAVRGLIESTADPVGAFVVHGRVNVGRALGAGTGPQLGTFVINRDRIVGGNLALGTVTLTQPAPPGGLIVTVASQNSAVASAPTSVLVQSGQSRASFNVLTSPVQAATDVRLTATLDGVTRSVTVTVTPSGAELASVTLARQTVVGPARVRGTVTLAADAPATVRVTIETSGQDVRTARFVTIPRGRRQGYFVVACGRTSGVATITARLDGQARSATLTISTPG